MSKHKREKWLEEAKPRANWKAFLRFVRMARKEYREKNFESLKVSLTQAKGRIHNLLIELEEESL